MKIKLSLVLLLLGNRMDGMACRMRSMERQDICVPTYISQAQTISTAGSYYLSQSISGIITITEDKVSLDLNNYKVTGSLEISANKSLVTIKNGMIDGTNVAAGISVGSGCDGITIENITVHNAIRGIYFESNSGALVDSCTLNQNTTGIQIESSYNITVQNCTANCNTQAGFELITSATNCVLNCKAITTGEGNTNEFGDESNVYGFVSRESYGNVFERCIANSTQNLTATDYGTRVAGFALLGTGTQCNKIIECESANATTSPDGITIPYGIVLPSTLSSFTKLVGLLNPAFRIEDVDWSPDGRYVALGASGLTDELQIYNFDPITETASFVASGFSAAAVDLTAWHPSGQFISIFDGAGPNELKVVQFNPAQSTVSTIASLDRDAFLTQDWHPQGKYLALGGTSITQGGRLQVIQFDPIQGDLTSILTSPIASGTVFSVHWRFDGNFLAVGGNGLSEELLVYSFDEGASSLTEVAAALGTDGQVNSLRWSPDGRFLAAAGTGLTGSSELHIFLFDEGAQSLTEVDSAIDASENIQSIDWSPDGDYLVVGLATSSNRLQLFSFDKGSNSLNLELQHPITDIVYRVRWSPDGGYIVAGTEITNEGFQVYSALEFPSKNIIKNNTVYCNSNGTHGVGISGSSIANLIIQNTSYNNPFNYVFVTNEFNQLFNQAPSDLQNLGLLGCELIRQPVDCGLIHKQNQIKLESALATLLTKI